MKMRWSQTNLIQKQRCELQTSSRRRLLVSDCPGEPEVYSCEDLRLTDAGLHRQDATLCLAEVKRSAGVLTVPSGLGGS